MSNGTITMTGSEYDALAGKIATLESELAKLKGEYEWVASINTALDESNQSAWGELARLRAGQEPMAYQCREISEGDWADCDKKWFDYCERSPLHDTRKLYTTPQPSAVPDGWKLVPVEPTAGMLDVAVSHALTVSLSRDYSWSAYMRDVWLRMVEAYPVDGK